MSPGRSGERVRGRVVLALLLGCSAAHAQPVHSPPAATIADEQRPRIGLVLGGGGARGAAHIGVLRVLEELHVPIDCVAGTSMGSLIGAAYASGMTSRDIERLVNSIDWKATFGGSVTRSLQPQHLKKEYAYSNRLEFGLKGTSLVMQSGLVATQQIESLLRSMVADSRYQTSFDDLAIPFRAVATDIRTGELVLLDRGDVSLAMRASMAVPGAFSPVPLDGRLLVDGGLVRNLPIDVARDLCADVVIAASMQAEPVTAADLQSALAVVGQMIGVMIDNNQIAQLATLGPADVSIRIALPGMTSAEFQKVPQAIPRGEQAARAVSAQLARYSVSPEAYAAWRAGLARAEHAPVRLAGIDIVGLKRVNPDVLAESIESRVGERLDEARVVDDAQRIFAFNEFEKVDYRIWRDAGDRATVQFLPLEKPWGPDYVRFDLGLTSSGGGDTGYVLRLDHRRTWINSRGATWRNALQVGTTALIESSVFQPLDLQQRWFVEPGFRLSRSHEDLFDDGSMVARYKLIERDLWLDAGVELETWGELRIGLRRGDADFVLGTGALVLPESENVRIGGVTSRFVIDTRDSAFAPSRGSYLNAGFYSASESLGSDTGYRKARLFAQHVIAVGRDLVYLEVAGGSDFASEAPPYDLFTLGGVGELAGFQYQELRGREFAFGRIAYFRKLSDLQSLLGQAIYAGLSIEAGNMFERIDGPAPGGPIFGSSIFLGGRTPLGPALLVLGFAEGGHSAAYLQIGRPLRER